MPNPISMADRCYFWSRAATLGGATMLTLSVVFIQYAGVASLVGLIAGSILVGAGLISTAILASGQ